MKREDILGWSLLFAAFLVGCSDGATSSAEALTVEMRNQMLVLKIAPRAHLRYDTCDLFQGLDVQQGKAWVAVRNELPISYYGQQSTLDGYMLDGKFVPPSTFAGCDLVQCADLPDGEEVGDATEYVANGTTTPPANYVYPEDFTRPATIVVYESHPLHGVRVRTHVKYFTDMECDTPHNVALEIDVP